MSKKEATKQAGNEAAEGEIQAAGKIGEVEESVERIDFDGLILGAQYLCAETGNKGLRQVLFIQAALDGEYIKLGSDVNGHFIAWWMSRPDFDRDYEIITQL